MKASVCGLAKDRGHRRHDGGKEGAGSCRCDMAIAISQYSEELISDRSQLEIPAICVPLSVQNLVVHIHQGRKPDRGSNDSPKHLLQLEPTEDAAPRIHPHAHTRHVHRCGAEGCCLMFVLHRNGGVRKLPKWPGRPASEQY